MVFAPKPSNVQSNAGQNIQAHIVMFMLHCHPCTYYIKKKGLTPEHCQPQWIGRCHIYGVVCWDHLGRTHRPLCTKPCGTGTVLQSSQSTCAEERRYSVGLCSLIQYTVLKYYEPQCRKYSHCKKQTHTHNHNNCAADLM